MRISGPLVCAAAASALLIALPEVPRADTRIFSVQTDRQGVTVKAVSRNGRSLPVAGQSGARTFFEINAGNETIPCKNQLAFTTSNGQRLEYIVDLCAHKWQVTLPLATAQAPPSSAPPSAPTAPASITISTDDPDVGIEEVNLDRQPMTISSRKANAVTVRLPPGQAAKCDRDLGLALTDGRRIARTVNICRPNGAIVVALDSDTATPPPPPAAGAQPPVASAPPTAPAPSPAKPEVIENLKWEFGTEGDRASLAYALPNSDQVEFHASCGRGSREVEISLERSAPDVRPGATVPVTLTAGTFAKTYDATGSDINALTGTAHPELTVPVDDPLWPALIKEDYLVIQTGSAPAYVLSLKGSSAAGRPFLQACSSREVASPAPPGAPPVGQVGGDYSCSEEGTIVSQQTQIESQLIFHNDLPEPIQLFWLDYDGRRRPGLSLGPGETGVQPTFFTHPWLVADAGGRCLAIYFARRRDSEIIIGRR